MRRRLAPATAAAAVLFAAGLTGCSAQALAEDCVSSIGPGALSNNVTVLGEFGEDPEVSIPSDITIQAPQRTIVHSSEDRGAPAGTNSLVSANIAYFDSASGEQLGEPAAFSPNRGASYIVNSPENESPITEAMKCTAPGDRTVIALEPMESLAYMDQLGLTPGASLVIVADTVSTSPLHSDGRSVGLPSGFPAVVTDETGQPGVVLPPRDAPADTRSAASIIGTGQEISADDSIIGQALIVSWEEGEKLADTRDNGSPMPLGTEESAEQSGITFRGELTGHTVGSQVVIIEGGEGAQVIVVDILAAG